MNKTSTFSARARVVDMLGREQIADAPTAISELLKNAVDALANETQVRFNASAKSLQIEDNGLGMRTQDLLDKWLVLATESKKTQKRDEGYLKFATKQQKQALKYSPLGEKGIGRLAVAALGRGVLIWTRWGEGEQAQRTLLFIHWKLFEHPRLSLSDIIVPYVEIRNREATISDAQGLMDDFSLWIKQRDLNHWTTKSEQAIKDGIIADLSESGDFVQALEQTIKFQQAPGTLFVILGAEENVEQTFIDARQQYQASKALTDTDVPEGFKLLLGFSDPFSESPPRLKVEYVIDGQPSTAQLEFWKPSDFANADHEIDIQVNEAGFVSGTVRRYQEELTFNYNLPQLPRYSSLPGAYRIHIGYIAGKANSRLTNELWAMYESRLKLFGALYVYRDGIKVLPYGRIDQDFVGFEERRSLKAGTYFFSHRRMFGAVYLMSEENDNLRDKAGREGFIKNGAYRGFVFSLRDIFKELADQYFGTGPMMALRTEEERRTQDKEAERQSRQRAEEELQVFDEDFSCWRGQLPIHRQQIKSELDQIRRQIRLIEDNLNAHNELLECDALIKKVREELSNALDDLGTAAPTFAVLPDDLREGFDIYLSDRQIFEQQSRSTLGGLTAAWNKLATRYQSDQQRATDWQRRLHDVFSGNTLKIEDASEQVRTALQEINDQKVPLWKKEQKSNLDFIVEEMVGADPVQEVMADSTGNKAELLEGALARQQSRVREVYLPFWSAALKQLQTLDNAEGTEATLGGLFRSLERAKENERTFAELAQLGLVVESLDHEYNVLFSDILADLDGLKQHLSPDSNGTAILNHLRGRFESLEAKQRFLSPLYRRKLGGLGQITGSEIRNFIEELYSVERRQDVKIDYSNKFSNRTFRRVNKPILLAATANIVGNALYWVQQNSASPHIRFTSVLGGFVISDSGPGIPPRDRERVFDAFFSRRPYGRGLGLYIAKTNLETIGLEIHVAEEAQPQALPGANFVITTRNAEEDMEQINATN